MTDTQTNTNPHPLAQRMVEEASPVERRALLEWTTALMEIRNSSDTKFSKGRLAVKATIKREILIPILKTNLKAMKENMWDDRNWATRIGIIGLTIGTLGFSSEAAGIAAFGRAIAVPIWLVLAASGTFLGTLIDMLQSTAVSSGTDVSEDEDII